MIFTKSSPKRTEKVSSDEATISFDLLSNLTYMAAVATGGPSRDVILEAAIRQNYKTGIYFRQVYLLAKRLGFEYARAFRLAAGKAKAEVMKNLLLRFAGAINSGVSEAEFLAEEARVEREQYINRYHRSLESMTKWGDAYAALLVSVSLVVVVGMISTMLNDFGNAFVLMPAGVMVMITSFGVYIIFRTAPVEVTTYQNRLGPPGRRWAKRLLYTVFPAGFIVAVFLGYSYGVGLLMLGLGVALLPAGVMSWRDTGRITKLDQEGATFIRSLGNVTASLGCTVSAAIAKIDRRSLGTLEPYIRRLQIRLERQIRTDKCWDAFRDEVGSELVNRTTRMFVDGVALGGPPDEVGAIASAYAMDSALMRARRNVSAAPFAFLCVPLHFAMSALLVFVLEIMNAFNTRVENLTQDLESQAAGAGSAVVMPSLPVFQPQDIGMMFNMTLVALLAMTIANALAPKFAVGGHPLNAAFFGGITSVMTGLNLWLIPPIAEGILLSSPV